MIRTWLDRLPSFGAKVTWLLTLTAGLAVLLVSGALVAFAYFDLRNDLIAAVESQGELVSMNSGAPLAFNDADSGREALAALRVTPHIAAATVFDQRGARFATFARATDLAPEFPLSASIGLERHQKWRVLTLPVDDVGERLGFVQIVFDLRGLNQRVVGMLLTVLGVAMAAMMLIYVVARGIRHVLVRPVDDLAQTAREISHTRNYALRAKRISSDEIGQFTDAFNNMLEEIQTQHAELQLARNEAERASRMKDEFLATLSHELRTPMTPILGWAQILLRSAHDGQRVQQGAEIIERNARIQTQIIDDLLDMSRIISGKMLLNMQLVDAGRVAEAALATVQPAAEARGVDLRAKISPGLPQVRADPNRLQQVLWNLLTNGIKFTPRGGRVELHLSQEGSHLRLSVIDNGLGMKPEFLPHVFERFRQADSSTTRAHGGLGLGLAIVKQLVEQQGGDVRASSEGPDRGSRFDVDLPVAAFKNAVTLPEAAATSDARVADAHEADVDADAGVPTGSRPATPLAGRRLIVVDDDDDARRLMGHLLGEAGAQVRAAASAAEAMALLPDYLPDAMVSDIGMPGCDGYEFIRRVRLLEPGQGGRTPAIALTAFAREEDRARALEAGFQTHLSKPVEAAELIAACVALLQVRA